VFRRSHAIGDKARLCSQLSVLGEDFRNIGARVLLTYFEAAFRSFRAFVSVLKHQQVI
jgi:hypothetical protein